MQNDSNDFYGESAITLFEIFPMDSISLSIKSPTARNSAGFRCIPTPDGVPVKITSPGFSVMHLKRRKIEFKFEFVIDCLNETHFDKR